VNVLQQGCFCLLLTCRGWHQAVVLRHRANKDYCHKTWVELLWLALCAAAGFFASACSLPFDFVKTRLQKMTPNPDGTMPYKGPVDCAMQTLRSEGPLKFYTGFPTYMIR
jgi:hypothetical protein